MDADSLQTLASMEVEWSSGGPAVFSPDGRYLAAETWNGYELRDLETGDVVNSISGANGWAGCLEFTPDMQYVVYLLADRTTGGPYHYIAQNRIGDDSDFTGYPVPNGDLYHTVTCPALSPDGQLIAAGYSDSQTNAVLIWDRLTAQVRRTLDGHASAISSVAFSPNGELLASGARDGTVRLWHPDTGDLAGIITGFADDIDYVEFADDGLSLEVSVADGSRATYDLAQGRLGPADAEDHIVDPFEGTLHEQGYSSESPTVPLVVFSPDGQFVALASNGVLVFDVAEGSVVRWLATESSSSITGMTYSRDGQSIAAVTSDGSVTAWDVSSGRRRFTNATSGLSFPQAWYASSGVLSGVGIGSAVQSQQGLAFSPDGTLLAIGDDLEVEVWDASSGRLLRTMQCARDLGYPTQVSFSDDGQILYAVFDLNRSAAVWDIRSGRLLRVADLPPADLQTFTFSDLDGPAFLRNNVADERYWIELWDLDTDTSVEFPVPKPDTEPLVVSPDRSLVAAVSGEDLLVWDTASQSLLDVLSLDTGRPGLAFSPDSRLFAVADGGRIELYELASLLDFARTAGFAPATLEPTPTEYVDEYLSAWPTATPMPALQITPVPVASPPPSAIPPNTLDHLHLLGTYGDGSIQGAFWSRDSKALFLTTTRGVYQYDSYTLAWEGRYLADVTAHGLALLSNGGILASATSPEGILAVSSLSPEPLLEKEGYGIPAISSDGQLLAAANEDGDVDVWSTDSRELVATLRGRTVQFVAPVFSPDGLLLAAIQSDGSVRIWDSSTGLITNGVGRPDSNVGSLSFSADGRLLVTAAGGSAWAWPTRARGSPIAIHLYDPVPDGNLVLYPGEVTTAAISPDAKFMAVGTSEHDILLYAFPSRQLIRELVGHAAPISLLAFSPGGGRLLSVDADGVLMTWDVASGAQINRSESHPAGVEGMAFRRDNSLDLWLGNNVRHIAVPEGSALGSWAIPAGTVLSVSGNGEQAVLYSPFSASILPIPPGALAQPLEGEAQDIFVEYYWEGDIERKFYGATYSPQGDKVATFGAGGVWIHDAETGVLQIHFLDDGFVRRLQFSPDGRWVLASRHEFTYPMALFDAGTGEMVMELPVWADYCQEIRFAPDGSRVGAIVVDRDTWEALFQMLSAATGELEWEYAFEEGTYPFTFAFDPFGTVAAVGLLDGRVLFLDLTTRQQVHLEAAMSGRVTHIEFSPDGTLLASASSDGTVAFWGIEGPLLGQSDYSTSAGMP